MMESVTHESYSIRGCEDSNDSNGRVSPRPLELLFSEDSMPTAQLTYH
jgi:hypothetical protein